MSAQEMRGLDKRDRVRSSTDDSAQRKFDRETVDAAARFADAGPEAISRRLEELDGESDVERVLEINASILTLIGIVLAAFVSPWFLILSAVVASSYSSTGSKDGVLLCRYFDV